MGDTGSLQAWQVLSNLLASPSHFDLELYDSLPSVEGTETWDVLLSGWEERKCLWAGVLKD